MYYLETSSIRTVGGKLQQIAVVHECRTSALVLFELLAGLREKPHEYNARKGAIAAVIASGIEIEWCLHTTRLTRAFGRLPFPADDESTVRPMIDCLTASHSMEHYLRMMDERQLTSSLEELEREDKDLAGALQMILQRPPLRDEVAAFVQEHMPRATEEWRSEVCRRMVNLNSVVSRHSDGKAIAYKCAVDCIGEPSEAELDEIVASHDGSLSLFMNAFSQAISMYWLRDLHPGKNDLADLLHLVYLRDGDVLVSEEGKDRASMQIIRGLGMPVQSIATL